MSKVTIEVKLSDEDRAALSAVTSAVEAFMKASGKAAPKAAAKPDKKKAAAAAEADEDFDDTDGEGDGDADGDADADFDADGDGDETEAKTREDVRAALKALAAKSNQADAVKLMKKHGGTDKLSELPEGKFAAVITAANAAVKKLAK